MWRIHRSHCEQSTQLSTDATSVLYTAVLQPAKRWSGATGGLRELPARQPGRSTGDPALCRPTAAAATRCTGEPAARDAAAPAPAPARPAGGSARPPRPVPAAAAVSAPVREPRSTDTDTDTDTGDNRWLTGRLPEGDHIAETISALASDSRTLASSWVTSPEYTTRTVESTVICVCGLQLINLTTTKQGRRKKKHSMVGI